ncbi:hypothetical protein CVT26_008247 [Gymnopilus dilepis]|uniref:Uncharacterized protein n=1 Tax=Gymnopilus dilepis TaxID=231916 RepID=A0A409XXF3_9AGAR|nr:hypothetical protein CVT26_008247 [Gymnopilus dilepis]
MSDPIAQASSEFKTECAAEALLFYGGAHKGLRVEAREIALEFTDNAYIGTDPEGFLFYNDVKDLTKSGTHTYSIQSVTYINTTYAIIDFVWGGQSKSYARFVAKDPANIAYQMGNYSSTGQWIDLDANSANAVIEKTSSNEIQIHIKSISKSGRWTSSPTISSDSKFSASTSEVSFVLLPILY